MVFDPEETKSTGLVNRLIAEKDAPKCDVFWSNDPLRMEILKQRGILALYRSPEAREIPAQFKAPEGYWTGFSGRIRVILVNKDLVKPKDYPHGIFDLLDARWKGTFALANPPLWDHMCVEEHLRFVTSAKEEIKNSIKPIVRARLFPSI